MNIRLIAYTPDPDGTCAIAARACRTDNVPEDGGKALETALKMGHGSVAEHAVFTFAVEGISRACSHQLVRHRLASYCQQSQRSVEPKGHVRPVMTVAQDRVFERAVTTAFDAYKELLAMGMPKENARYVLPEASKTSLVVTMNGRELRHFLALRTAPEAQWEIRELARRMKELAQGVAPVLIETVERR